MKEGYIKDMGMLNGIALALFLCLFVSSAVLADQNVKRRHTGPVTYDGRSLIIGGHRELLFSGSIHYPRSTPDMWPGLIKQAKQGGLNTVETYVFWNVHEPVQGQFNFQGQCDIVRFLRLIAAEDMYAIVRLGPFIQAEWNHGGLPYWLREVPDIIFRSDNAPFKFHMERYVRMIVEMMRKENLFSAQGGPIILAQIENEYSHLQASYKQKATSYMHWAAELVTSFQVDIPWVMCKQNEAPGSIINSCNGRHCGDTFPGPNNPNKPHLWTENWTAQFRVFGDPPSQRAAEDIAFSVARWFSRNGTLVNYYMYYGGTNFGRTSSSFTTTRYYDEAPLDEFGLEKEPKHGHLKEVQRALNLCKRALLWGDPTVQTISQNLEIVTFEKAGTDLCSAFLANNHTTNSMPIDFRGQRYFLPARSISILPDCKTVVYNSDMIVSQHNHRAFIKSEAANKDHAWQMYNEIIPFVQPSGPGDPHELYSLLKDTTDYGWHTTVLRLSRWDLPVKPNVRPVIRSASLGHGLLAFVNGEFVGHAHGSKIERSFVFEQPINLREGDNHIAFLSYVVGLPDSGAYMEKRFAGIRGASILGLNTGTVDLDEIGWGHQVGLDGEKKRIFTEGGGKQVKWTPASPGKGGPLTWYKRTFDAPEGDCPVAIRMSSMGKGFVWVNGNNIGRYWSSYLSPLNEPSQSEYHIPRSFLKPTNNLLVIFEEEGGELDKVAIEFVTRDTICSFIKESYPPNVMSWEAGREGFREVVENLRPTANLQCPRNKVIIGVDFASFGNPDGYCGAFVLGKCDIAKARHVVEQACLGKNKCLIPVVRDAFIENNADPCPDVVDKTLAVQAACGIRN